MINTNPNHKHTYDAQGRMTCFTLEDKIYIKAGVKELLYPKKNEGHHHDEDEEEHDHEHEHGNSTGIKQYLPAIISLTMLLIGIAADYYFKPAFFTGYTHLVWYGIAYLPVGIPVMKEGWKAIQNKELFTEFTLMVLATVGIFAIGQYPEGVAVMLFYAIGELFQIRSVPTTMIFKNNEVKWRQSGVFPTNEVIRLVAENL